VSETRQKSVVDKIRELILSQSILPGERLHEVHLSKTLNVSRTPIREALVVLQQEGLVTYRKNRGHIVREFAMKDVLDAYVVRGTIEGLACRLVAEHGLSEVARERLQSCLDAGDRILSGTRLNDDDLPAWRAMNHGFHQTILLETCNSLLRVLAARTLAIPFLSSRVVHWHNYKRIYRSHEDHHAIFDAICEREGTRAESVMREHIYLAIGIVKAEYGHLFAKGVEEGSRPEMSAFDIAL
jgi:GntR family transcriptional regulator, vanillate catabolism transcriptional regulator